MLEIKAYFECCLQHVVLTSKGGGEGEGQSKKAASFGTLVPCGFCIFLVFALRQMKLTVELKSQ